MGKGDSRRQRNHQPLSSHQLAQSISHATVLEEDRPIVRQEQTGIFIPRGADLDEVISELEAIASDRRSGDETATTSFTLNVPPWEGARALALAVQQTFGFVRQLPDGHRDRRQLQIHVGDGKTEHIPWGWLDLPGLSGYVAMGTTVANSRVVFSVTFYVMRKYQDRIERLMQLAANIASAQSLHRGKAFTVSFRNAGGDLDAMSVPTFFPLPKEKPIFSKETEEAIERNIFVLIRHAAALQKKGISLKRGALFSGKYGVGKTLLAGHIARVATSAGWTFIYVKNADELPDAIRFAERYQPVVIFGEDIDRVAGIERTDKVNELLNQLDGIDGKTVQMITILTTNHEKEVNEAMLRPGRIDLVLRIGASDADTVERMLREFGEGVLAQDVDLTEPSLLLAGQSPARIREMLQRSTFEALRRTDDVDAKVTTEDLVAMAKELCSDQTVAAIVTSERPLANGHDVHP